jgi:hypothetical protein
MNRDGKMLTVSITGIELKNNEGSMKYIDIINNTVSLQQFSSLHLQSVA